LCYCIVFVQSEIKFCSIIPKQFPRATGTVILKTDVTVVNHSLCVTDVATLVKSGEQKTICLETSRCFIHCCFDFYHVHSDMKKQNKTAELFKLGFMRIHSYNSHTINNIFSLTGLIADALK
jgi:hypothetical protein